MTSEALALRLNALELKLFALVKDLQFLQYSIRNHGLDFIDNQPEDLIV